MGSEQLFSLEGKVALITGAGAGQGRIFAKAFAARGASVWCTDANLTAARSTAESIGDRGRAFGLDVRDYASAEACAAAIRAADGRLDVLVNNAGVASKGARTHELALEDWNAVIAVNLTGVFHATRAALPLLRLQGGSIVTIASIIGLVGLYPDFPMVNTNYAASKAALVGFTRQLAAEYAAENIRANVIAPGWHAGSGLKQKIALDDIESERFERVIAAGVPMRRRGLAEELIGLALFLASDASSYITGQTFIQDGGWTAV